MDTSATPSSGAKHLFAARADYLKRSAQFTAAKINYPIFKAQAINIPNLINAEAKIIFLPGDAKIDSWSWKELKQEEKVLKIVHTVTHQRIVNYFCNGKREKEG